MKIDYRLKAPIIILGGILLIWWIASLPVFNLSAYKGMAASYKLDAVFSPKSETPREALTGLQQALADENYAKAARYLAKAVRSELIRDISRDTRRQKIVSMDDIELVYETGCQIEEICQKQAVYIYDYELTEAQQVEVEGKSFIVPSGRYQSRIYFIKNNKGRWQIRDI